MRDTIYKLRTELVRRQTTGKNAYSIHKVEIFLLELIGRKNMIEASVLISIFRNTWRRPPSYRPQTRRLPPQQGTGSRAHLPKTGWGFKTRGWMAD